MRWTRVHTAVTASVVVLALIVAGLFVWGPLGSNGDKPRDISAGVQAKGKKLPDKLHARNVTDGNTPVVLTINPKLFATASDTYEITPPGPLPSVTTFRLPLDAGFVPSDEWLLMPLTATSPDGPWEPVLKLDAQGKPTAELAMTLSPDNKYAYVTTNHLSFFTIVKVWIGKAVDVVKDAAGKVIGSTRDVLNLMGQSFHSLTENLFYDAPAPVCGNPEAALQDNYTLVKDPGDTLLTCFGVENGVRVMRAVNHRPYPLLLHHTNMTVLEAGPWFRARLAQVSRAVSGDDSVLFPGEQITYKVDLPAEGGTAVLSSEFDGLAQSLYSLEVALRLALLFRTNFGSGTGIAADGALVDQSKMIDLMDDLLQGADCGSLIWDHSNIDFGEVLKRCAGPDSLLTAFGKNPLALLAAPILVVAPVIAYFKSSFNALGDQFNGRDAMKVTITRANLTKLCPNGAANCPDIRQADIDGDGQKDQVSLVINPDEDSCGYYEVHVLLATGQEVTGGVCFGRGPMINPEYKQTGLSFVGFAPVNATPGDEIVVKLHYWTNDPFYSLGPFQTWGVYMLTLKGDRLDAPEVGTGWFPYYAYDIHIDGWEAQGFQCTKRSDGTPQLVWWNINVTDNSNNGVHEYTLTKSVFVPSPSDPTNFEPANAGSQDTKPLGDRNVPKQMVSELSNSGCQGVGQLPLPTYWK